MPRKPAVEVIITTSKQDSETGCWSYKVEDKAGLQVNLRDYTTEPQWFSESSLSNNMETLSLRSMSDGAVKKENSIELM